MAHTEPMDVDTLPSDFDDKENSLQNSNVFLNNPSTEKGYEELDTSEFNMKLRYSITPANSPMSRSYTANNKGDSGPNSLNNTVVIDSHLTRSLNSTMTKTDVPRTPKIPLQALPTSLYTNSDRRSCDREGNVTVKVTGTDNDDNLSLPSTASSAVQTPEATTPTKPDGSPIMRGLKSVLNLFRSSHSPVPPEEVGSDEHQPETQVIQPSEPQPVSSTPCNGLTPTKNSQSNPLLASTPISHTKIKDSSNASKRNSPLKDSVVFNQDLAKELQWQNETEIFFKHEKIPIHKLLFQSGQLNVDVNTKLSDHNIDKNTLNSTVEHMDISNTDVSYKSVIEDKTLNASKVINSDLGVESDNDYVDCETSDTNKSHILETVQEIKSSQVVFQTDTIPHQTCLIEYIESINKPDNVNHNISTESLVSKTINETSSVTIETSSKLKFPLVSEIDVSDYSSRPLQNKSTFKTTEITDTPSELITEVFRTNISSTEKEFEKDEFLKKDFENEKHSSITDEAQIQTEDPITTCKSFIPQYTNVHQSCVEISTCSKNSTDSDITVPRNLQNLPTNNTFMKIEDALNICTDDENTNRILFDINAILSHVNPNYDQDEISNSTSKTFENDLSKEVTDINDTIVITSTENIEENVVNSSNVDKESEIIEELNDRTLVFDDNVLKLGDNNIIETATVYHNKYEINNTDLQNMNVNNSHNLPDIEKQMTKMEFDSKDAKCIPNVIVDSINNDLKHNDELLDITMDSLEHNVHLNDDHTHIQIKTGISSDEFKCGTELLEHTPSEQKHDFPKDEPLPLDVPLPSDDDIEKECSLDLHSLKNKQNVEVISEMITDKTYNENSNLDFGSFVDRVDNFKTTEVRAPFHLHDDASNIISAKNEIGYDVKMSTDFSNSIQDISQLSTNLTTCLQKINIGSDIIESQHTVPKAGEICRPYEITTEINQQIIVDFKSELPDVVQAVTEIDTPTNTKEIVNEYISLEGKTKAKVNDENNSPHVSMTELDLNLISNKPDEVIENPTESEIFVSPPISPQHSKTGYNINFDEIENPFATKTNIRMSPIPGELNETFNPVNNIKENTDDQRRPPNRRISQPTEKKIYINKKRFNTSIESVKITDSKAKKFSNKIVKTQNAKEVIKGKDNSKCEGNILVTNEEYLQTNNSIPRKEDYCNNRTVTEISDTSQNETELKNKDETITLNDQNFNDIFGSADQNLNTTKSDTRNVFSIPEIDDVNFNPFVTKSRICLTPPPMDQKDIENNTTNINTTVCIEDNVQDETKVLSNASNITSSSINTDKDVTVRECNTEDEDTVEGPFFEAEDLVDVVKVPDFEVKKDTMQFNDLPLTSNNDDMDKGEFFIDAEAFEFLLNQNKSNVVVDSGKESLFLKFDPLFAKRVSSDGVLAALSSIQKKQSTPKKFTRPLFDLAREETQTVPVPGPSNISSVAEQMNEVTVSKPMMVVNPAVTKQPVATPRISLTPKTNRQSLNFMSPAMVVIDRLLSLSNNTSLLDQDVPIETNRNDANSILVQLRELLSEKELHVHGLKCESRELKDRLSTLESKVKSLESEGEARLRKVKSLNEQLAEKEKSNKSMAAVVEQYEWTIANMISEMQQEKKRNAEERARLISERDEQTAHLASMERSFSDLHSKYEKCKQVILTMKANEDAYKQSLNDFDENLLKMQKNYDLLKQHATSKLNDANQELEKMNRSHEAEVLKLNAMIKRKELHIHSLEESLAQKSKAIEELTAICDELINKVG